MGNEENKVIRVAQVIGMAVEGGVESFVMNYYKHIDRTKIQFDFFVESTSRIIDKDLIESMGGKIVIIPHYSHPIRYVKTLTRLFKEGNYDIVHSNMNALSVFTLRAAKKAGIKNRIAHSHSTANYKNEKLRSIIKSLLRPFSKIYATDYFACSEVAGKWLFGNKTYKENKIVIINNAIEIDKFQFNEAERIRVRKELNIENSFLIGNVGRFVTQKNQLFLIDVFNEFQKEHVNSKLLLVGDGPLKDKMKQKIMEYKIDDKVIFAGVRADVSIFYNAMDCFLFPSIYEGIGICLIEAQVNGMKCIVSENVPREASISDFVDFIPIELNCWIDKLNFLYTDSKRNYVNLYNTKFDIIKETKRIEDIYFKMLETGRR